MPADNQECTECEYFDTYDYHGFILCDYYVDNGKDVHSRNFYETMLKLNS